MTNQLQKNRLLQDFTILLLVIVLLIGCSTETPTSTPSSFAYPVYVEAKDTKTQLPDARVIIHVANKAPLDGITDDNGFVRIPFDLSYVDKPAIIIIEADGFQSHRQEIDLRKDMLPDFFQLNRETVTKSTNTPTPSPTAESIATFTPTNEPTDELTATPTDEPTQQPTTEPTNTSTNVPTPTPTEEPTPTVTNTPVPTNTPEPIPIPTPAPPGDMVRVPAGDFFMGSLPNHNSSNTPGLDRDPQPEGDEFPQRTVFLPEFWIDRTEVTNAKYRECVNAGVCAAQSGGNPDYHLNPVFGNYPAIYVSWDDARSYCEWVGKRLPTEAEWEKAARGTDGRIWPWGNALKDNPSAPVARAHVGDGTANDVTEVGSYPDGASPYGALDMTGNVWEWVNDWYQFDYYVGRPDPDTSPPGPSEDESNGRKVIRGGSYKTVGVDARTAERNGVSPGPSFDIGFRCAWSP